MFLNSASVSSAPEGYAYVETIYIPYVTSGEIYRHIKDYCDFVYIGKVYSDIGKICDLFSDGKYFGESELNAERKIIESHSIPIKEHFMDYYE